MINRILILAIMLAWISNAHADSGNSDAAAAKVKEGSPDTGLTVQDIQDLGISQDALFNMLAAEFSVYRNQYGSALDFYLSDALDIDNNYILERVTQLAMHEKRYVDMLESSIRWQANAPENPQAHFFASVAYSLNMQPNIALEHMRKVLQLDGETDFTRLVNALPAGHPSEPFYINELFQYFDAHTDSFDVPLALALLHHRQKDAEKAVFYANQALKNAPYNQTIINYTVRIFVKNGAPDKAIAAYKAALQNQPEDQELRHAFAQFATRYDLEEARQQFLVLLGASPSDDYILYNLGLIYLEQENVLAARKMFTRLVKLRKRASAANYYLGQIHYHLGENKEALDAFNAITDKSEQKRSYEHMARIYLEQGNVELADNVLNIALAAPIDQDHLERLQVLKSMVFEKQGDTKAAYTLLTELLHQNPDSIELRYSRAMLAETENELSKMESDLRHIINIQPDSALALNALGYTLANKTDRYREAYKLIKQAHDILPDDPAVLDSLGWVLYRMGRVNEAIIHLKQALIILPDAEVAAHLGEALWVSGDKQSAKEVFREALNNNPDHSGLKETIKRLDVSL